MGDLRRSMEVALDVAIFGAVMLPACIVAWGAMAAGRGAAVVAWAMAEPPGRQERPGAQSF